MRKAAAILIASTLLTFTAEAQALSLSEAIDIALRNNPSLLQTQKSVDAAVEEIRIAKGNKGFSVSLTGSADASKSEGTSDSESTSARISGSIPIYSGGRLEAELKSANLSLDIAKFDYLQAIDDLTYQVAVAYVDALENKATNEVDVETRNNLAEHEELIANLYQAGSKAKIDLLRAQVETSNANQDVSRSQAAHEISLTQLATLMSLDSITNLEIEDLNTSTDLIDIETCITRASEQRNDLKSDELKIQRAQEQITSAKSGWLPTLNASAGTGFNAHSDKWDPTSDATAGLSASWNIFDSKVTRAKVDEAKIEAERLRLAMQSDVEAVNKDVISAHKNLKAALVRLETTDRAVRLAEEERFIATERYKAGEGIILDILDAEVALKTARKNNVSAKYDVIRYRFELAHAMGKTYQ